MSSHFTDEEMRISQRLKDKISESKTSDLQFFQAAYFKAYLKQYNCIRDVADYRAIGAIPDYVVSFIL